MNPIRLCVIPTDPLAATAKKGEIKKRYWNPGNVFSEIHLIDFSDQPVAPGAVKQAAGRAKLVIHRLKRPGMSSLLQTIDRVQRLLAQIRPDVIRAFSPNWVGFVAARAGKRLDIPVVISIHGNFDETRRGLKGRISSLLEDYALSNATAVICMTQFLTKYARRHHAHADAVHVIYNKVDTRQCKPAPTTKRAGLLWVGRLDSPKRPDLAIEAAAKTKTPLTMIGNGEKKVALQQQARESGARVRFIPSVPHGRMAPYYQKAKVLVMASGSEGFCIPVLEAMASGLPVVASEIPAIAEVSGGAAVLVSNDESAVVSATQRLLQNGTAWKECALRGMERAGSLDGRRMEEKEKKLYHQLLGEQRS